MDSGCTCESEAPARAVRVRGRQPGVSHLKLGAFFMASHWRSADLGQDSLARRKVPSPAGGAENPVHGAGGLTGRVEAAGAGSPRRRERRPDPGIMEVVAHSLWVGTNQVVMVALDASDPSGQCRLCGGGDPQKTWLWQPAPALPALAGDSTAVRLPRHAVHLLEERPSRSGPHCRRCCRQAEIQSFRLLLRRKPARWSGGSSWDNKLMGIADPCRRVLRIGESPPSSHGAWQSEGRQGAHSVLLPMQNSAAGSDHARSRPWSPPSGSGRSPYHSLHET